jgi:hypothetical protein
MGLGDLFFDERSRPSAMLRSLIRARIYLLTGFCIAGAVCVTLAAKHSGASSVLKSLASSSISQPATERPEVITEVASGAIPDRPPSDPTVAPLRVLEPIGSSPPPSNDAAKTSSSDRQPAKVNPAAKVNPVASHGKVAKARAKSKAPRLARAARKQRHRSHPDWFGGGQYSRGYGRYGGFGGFGGFGGYGAGYGGL